MLQNRIFSFIAIFIVYVLASFAGFFIYQQLHFDFWLSLLISDIAATVITFIFSLIFKNASVYDPYWSVQPIVIIVLYAVFCGINTLGLLLVIAICFWGIRLTANWAYTFKNLTCQDWRYTQLKEQTKFFYPIVNFIGIHMIPTLIVYLCVLPAVNAIVLKAEFKPVCIALIAISFLAVILQGTADYQMHKFRKNGTGGFIRVGVWKKSRHPNYLGEILMWWGIGLTCFAAMPDKWYLLAGAVSNTLLFLCISIPLAENHQKRKPGFEEYKKQTRVLI